MSWWMGCNSAAGKRYRRRIMVAMALYVVILFSTVGVVKAGLMHGWVLYVAAVLPAIPIIAVLVIMGRYLHEETDEYLRMLTVRALLVATGVLLSIIVVNDFLRTLANRDALTPFVCFVVFFASFGLAQMVQQIGARRGGDE